LVTVIAIMESPGENFLEFSLIRFSTVMIGILCAFLVNLIFLPPKYETRLYYKVKETTEDILNLGETGSLTARFSSLQYYWGQFVENAFLGRGLLSDNWDNNPDLFIKQRYSYHLHDLGLFHIILNFGILGKLCAEVIEDLDSRAVRNLASCGAGRVQILLYGVLPTALPRFLTYILYRWEVIMRTTIVVGFVGAGGLGQQFKLSMSFFHYTDLTLLLLCYLILVFAADYLSEKARFFIK